MRRCEAQVMSTQLYLSTFGRCWLTIEGNLKMVTHYGWDKIPGALKKFPVSFWNLVDILVFRTFLWARFSTSGSTDFQILAILCLVVCNFQETCKNLKIRRRIFVCYCDRSGPITVRKFFVPESEPFMNARFIQTKVMLKTSTLQRGEKRPCLWILICHTLDLTEYLWFEQIPNPLKVCKELLIFRLWPKLKPPHQLHFHSA